MAELLHPQLTFVGMAIGSSIKPIPMPPVEEYLHLEYRREYSFY
jgi:hypothetical protein